MTISSVCGRSIYTRRNGNRAAERNSPDGPYHPAQLPLDQIPAGRGGRRSQTNDIDGVVTLAAWLPATDRGNTTPVTAEPATLVPGTASNGPGATVVAAAPSNARASVATRFVPAPAART